MTMLTVQSRSKLRLAIASDKLMKYTKRNNSHHSCCCLNIWCKKALIKAATFCRVFSVSISVLWCIQASAESRLSESTLIERLFEPSGVVQLDDGRILAVEDEPTSPFVILTPASNGESFDVSKLRLNTLLDPAVGAVNDLEGVTKDLNGDIYAITSQSRKSNGKRDRGREKIIKFSIAGDQIQEVNVRYDFRKRLVKAFPALKEASKKRNVKDENGLNIEGLTFSPDGKVLWVGLRAPVFDGKSILVAILNPRRALETGARFQFSEKLVLLDLNGGGVRDITYDPKLSGYLILSQRENTKKTKGFKLWLWNGSSQSSPSRVRIAGVKKLKKTEGIAPVRLHEKDQLLLLNDDGSRAANTPASYHLIDYLQLDVSVTQ